MFPGNSWTVQTGEITLDKSMNKCRFALRSYDTGATMFQRINLSAIWDSNSWPRSQAILNARMSVNVNIDLRGINSNGQISARRTLSKL